MSASGSRELRNLAVFGVGGVGGFVAARLGTLLTGTGVPGPRLYLIARGAHLEAMRQKGLRLKTPKEGELLCRPTLATDNPRELPPLDLCFLCVKGYDLAEAAVGLAPRVGEATVLIPLLNGVDIYDRLAAALPAGTVLPACIYIGSHLESPGIVHHTGGQGLIQLGRDPRFPAFDPQALLSLLGRAGIPYEWLKDPFPAVWSKYLFIASFGLVSAASGRSLGQILADPRLKAEVGAVMEEILALAAARGAVLAPDGAAKALEKAASFPPETRTSYQRDVEAKRPKNEGDLFGGAILRLGRELGVPVPVSTALFEKVQSSLQVRPGE